MKAKDFKTVVGCFKDRFNITSRSEITTDLFYFIINLALCSECEVDVDNIRLLMNEVEEIDTSELSAIGCDDDWWEKENESNN